MICSRLRHRSRSFLGVVVSSAMLAVMLTGVSQRPASALVTAVKGSAFGYYVNVGLFGGPRTLKGHGTTVPSTDVSYSPSVTLPAGGSATPVTANDPDGAKAQYGPAVIFGGIWPDNVASAPGSGPMSVRTEGTAGRGSVTSSASVVLHPTPIEVQCATGHSPPCTAPGGIGPGPLIAEEAHSTCTASESGVTGSATFVNGILELKYDQDTQLPIVTEPIPVNPPPNYTVSGTIDHVGDRFTIVLNEQVIGPDSITVNAAHMYLLGETARGDMVVASSTCSLTSTIANAAPVAVDDTFSTKAGTPLTVAAPGLLGNDTDANGNPLTATNAQAVLSNNTDCCRMYSFPSDPANGTVAINGNGSFTYTPDAGFSGTDTFTYVVRDPRGANDSGLVTITVDPAPASVRVVADFDGDADTDISVFRPATGAWYVQGRPTVFHGRDGDAAVPADYDGDGDADIAVFRPSNGGWYIQGRPAVFHGRSGDIPVPADYDADGDADLAVFRPSSGAWYVAGQPAVFFGRNGDIPVPSQYDADPAVDLAVFRPSSGAWYVQGRPTVYHGRSGDVPVPADYDGDGDADLAVFRPTNGGWYVQGRAAVFHGRNGDVPVPGHYAGNPSADIAVFRPANGGWYRPGQPTVFFGRSGDAPLPLPYATYQALG